MQKITEEAEFIMKERFGKDCIIALATTENGVPYVRNVNAYYENGAFYVITHKLSGKMKQIAKNSAVAVAGEWFTGHGNGIDLGYFGESENAKLAEKLRSAFAQWIDNGHNDFGDVNTRILCIRMTDGLLLSHGKRIDIDFGG